MLDTNSMGGNMPMGGSGDLHSLAMTTPFAAVKLVNFATPHPRKK